MQPLLTITPPKFTKKRKPLIDTNVKEGVSGSEILVMLKSSMF